MHLLECDDPTKPPRDPLNPVLPGEPSGPPDHRNTRVWCRYCDVYHYHSVEEIGSRIHRLSHCWVGDSLYLIAGYEIVVLPEETVPAPAQRRKPRYVDTRILHGWKGELSVDWRGVHDRAGHYRSITGADPEPLATWPEANPMPSFDTKEHDPMQPEFPMVRCAGCGDIFHHDDSQYIQGGARMLSLCSPGCGVQVAHDLLESVLPRLQRDIEYVALQIARNQWRNNHDR